MYKKAILLVVNLVVAGLFWFWVKPWVDNPTRFSDVSIWLRPLLLLTILSAVISLSFVLLKNARLWKILISVVVSLPFLFFFGFDTYYLLAVVLAILLHLYADSNIQAEVNERTAVNVRLIMQRGLSMIIMPLLIMVSFAYFSSSSVQLSAKKKQLPPTISLVVETTVNNFLGDQIKQLPPSEQKQAKSQIVSQVLNQMTQFLGPYFKYMPPILAFGLFLVLEGLSFIFVWLAVLLAMLIFWALKKSGFIRIRLVQKEAEELEF